jgi:hypothetical protein
MLRELSGAPDLGELIEPGSVFSTISRQFAPIHTAATDSKATVAQIAAYSTDDRTSTRINACPWLSHKEALVSDRGDGDGSTPTHPEISRADAPRRDIPARLLLSDRPEQPSAFSHRNTTQSSTPDLDR